MKPLSAITIFLLSVVSLTITSGCKSTKTPENTIIVPSQPMTSGGIRRMPKAVIYRTNGPWNNNVAVTLTDDGKNLLYFPGCYDVSEETEPMVLTGGWLLDRQGGISKNTAFLKWTMPEYHKFERTPSVDEILKAIIPEAKVVEVIELPMLTTEAQNDTAKVNGIIQQMYQR